MSGREWRELKPIPLRLSDFDAIEARIKRVFREVIFWPLMRELKSSEATAAPRLSNASDDLLKALRSGKVSYSSGAFSGRLTAKVSRQLKKAGAKWDRKAQVWKLPLKDMPYDLRAEIAVSEARFKDRMRAVDKKLSAIDSTFIANKFAAADLFDKAIRRTDRDIATTLKAISIAPRLSPESARKIADEWERNLRLYIRGFADEEIIELRKSIKKSVFAGNRHETMIDAIRKSYGVTERKAKFLARQETNLLVTKLKETRYAESGVTEYRWRCVAGSPKHPVRRAHRKLDGTVQKFNHPPIVSEPGQAVRRANPGQDFNCRCVAVPIVKF